jgi:NADPH:quinone reductase-like Zn-dependent oxidoreductase
MEQQMQAIGFRQYGAADVLEPLQVARPKVTPNSVLLRVAAAGINPADWRIRRGQLRFLMRAPFPYIPGADVAGTVIEVGSAVTRFQPGDAVYAMRPTIAGGGYAEYVAVDAAAVAAMPANLSFVEAAAVPLAALTALQALRDKAQLQPNMHLLVNGASGGVGTFAVQIAKAMGARVTAVCSGRNADLVRSLGADAVRDYTQADITGGNDRYDRVFDAIGHYPFLKWRRVLVPQGMLVSVHPLVGNPISQGLARLSGRRLASVIVQPSGTDLETLTGWMNAGQVRPVIDQVYPLAEAAAAHRHSETQRAQGKLVLVVDADAAPATWNAQTEAHAPAATTQP